jgi:hypothetical protein
MPTMTPTAEWTRLFAQWALPCSSAFLAVHGPRMRALEQELRERLAQNEAATIEWLGHQRPPIDSGAYQVLQRIVSRVRMNHGALPMDACLAFCPVTIVLTTTHTELPRIDVELFRNTRPQGFVDALLAHGLADDCNVGVDPLMLPSARIARIGLTELPALVTSMADRAAAAMGTDGTQDSGIPRPNEGMSHSVSIAGGRVIGSLLIPLLFLAEDLGELPDALNGNIPSENLAAFREAASQALTVALGRGGPVKINFIVSAPALIFDALLESTSAHCDTAAYWASRAAIEAGGTECTIVYGDTPDRESGQGLSIGFEAGLGVECNVRMFAIEQDDIDRYTEAFAFGAHAAGMTTVRIALRPAGDRGLN